MPKYLPRTLETSLSQFDTIINQQAEALAGAKDAKVSVADLCRLFQLRLDLADRFETSNPGPIIAGWIDPAWMLDHPDIPAALAALDRTRAEYEALLHPPSAEQPPQQEPEPPQPTEPPATPAS